MNPSPYCPLRDHTWKDVGGLMGLFLDAVFCSFVIAGIIGMVLLASLVMVVDNIAGAGLAILSKVHLHS